MPKVKHKLTISLDLLHPQSNPEKILVKLFRWLLASGRYIFVFVEALVLIAFIARFKLDADLAAKKEEIEQKIPYIESLANYELLIRQTQMKLSAIDSIKKASPDWAAIFQKIADQTPASVTITNINMDKDVSNAAIRIMAQTKNNGDLANFVNGLRSDDAFTSANIASVGLETGTINFTINLSARLITSGGKGI